MYPSSEFLLRYESHVVLVFVLASGNLTREAVDNDQEIEVTGFCICAPEARSDQIEAIHWDVLKSEGRQNLGKIYSRHVLFHFAGLDTKHPSLGYE